MGRFGTTESSHTSKFAMVYSRSMSGEVAGFFEWASERRILRRDPEGALKARTDRLYSDFRSTTVPLYGLPSSYECERNIKWGQEVPMRWGLPVGGTRTTRFGLSHSSSAGGQLRY